MLVQPPWHEISRSERGARRERGREGSYDGGGEGCERKSHSAEGMVMMCGLSGIPVDLTLPSQKQKAGWNRAEGSASIIKYPTPYVGSKIKVKSQQASCTLSRLYEFSASTPPASRWESRINSRATSCHDWVPVATHATRLLTDRETRQSPPLEAAATLPEARRRSARPRLALGFPGLLRTQR